MASLTSIMQYRNKYIQIEERLWASRMALMNELLGLPVRPVEVEVAP